MKKIDKKENMETKLAVFQKKEIRKTLYKIEWWFSVVDICSVLTDSQNPGAYWRKLKQRLNLRQFLIMDSSKLLISGE